MLDEVMRELEDALAYSSEEYEKYNERAVGHSRDFVIHVEMARVTAVELHAWLSKRPQVQQDF